MFDARLAAWIKPCIDGIAGTLARCGIQANHLTVIGFVIGLTGAGCIVNHHYDAGLVCILMSRLLDALDGAVARQTQTTDCGAFLDITLDFIFYASIPLAFAIADPAINALAAATLLFAYMGTSSSFLAYASMASKRGEPTTPSKGIFYVGGLTEAFETVLCYALMCLLPQHFGILAYSFAALCVITCGQRVLAACRAFK